MKYIVKSAIKEFLKRGSLSISLLRGIGFGEFELEKNIKNENLIKNSDGTYRINQKTIAEYLEELSLKELETCLIDAAYAIKIYPNSRTILLEMFTIYIRIEHYDTAFKILCILFNNENRNDYIREYYVYFLLISNFIKLPEKYNNLLFTLEMNDIANPNCDRINRVREDIFNNKYLEAYETLYNFEKDTKLIKSELITLLLLEKYIDKVSNLNKKIEELFDSEDYDAIIELLKDNPIMNNQYEIVLNIVNIIRKLEYGENVDLESLYIPTNIGGKIRTMQIGAARNSLCSVLHKNEIYYLIEKMLDKLENMLVHTSIKNNNKQKSL